MHNEPGSQPCGTVTQHTALRQLCQGGCDQCSCQPCYVWQGPYQAPPAWTHQVCLISLPNKGCFLDQWSFLLRLAYQVFFLLGDRLETELKYTGSASGLGDCASHAEKLKEKDAKIRKVCYIFSGCQWLHGYKTKLILLDKNLSFGLFCQLENDLRDLMLERDHAQSRLDDLLRSARDEPSSRQWVCFVIFFLQFLFVFHFIIRLRARTSCLFLRKRG